MEWRALFLEALALSSNIAAAERAAEMSPGSAYKLRTRDGDFRVAWKETPREGYERLAIKLLGRAINGQRKNLRGKVGNVIGYGTEFSEQLAMTLLFARRQSVRGDGETQTTESAQDFRKRLARKIAAIRKAGAHD